MTGSLKVHCKQCSQEWALGITLPMSLDEFAEVSGKAAEVGCPKCGANGSNVLCGPSPAAIPFEPKISQDEFRKLSDPNNEMPADAQIVHCRDCENVHCTGWKWVTALEASANA